MLMLPTNTKSNPPTVANTVTKSVIFAALGIMPCIVLIENGCTCYRPFSGLVFAPMLSEDGNRGV